MLKSKQKVKQLRALIIFQRQNNLNRQKKSKLAGENLYNFYLLTSFFQYASTMQRFSFQKDVVILTYTFEILNIILEQELISITEERSMKFKFSFVEGKEDRY